MDNSFFEYLQRLEVFSFFSGYPLLYAIIIVLAGEIKKKKLSHAEIIMYLLPISYGLSGVLFTAMLIRNLYPDYSWENIQRDIYHPFLVCWALITPLFLIRSFRKKLFYSLVHSLVFFLWLIIDWVQAADKTVAKTAMNIYTDSLLLQSGLLLTLFLIILAYSLLKKNNYIKPRD